MAVSFTVKDSGTGSTETFSTASITWSGGVGVILCASAYNSVASTAHHDADLSGGGDAWTRRADQDYRVRRVVSYLTNNSPSNGVIEITADDGGSSTYQDSLYFVIEVSGSDGTPPSNYNIDEDGGNAESGPQGPGTLTDSVDAGDLVLAIAMCESSSASHALSTGLSQIGGSSAETSSNTRSGIAGEGTDTTPQHTWTGSQGNAMIAAVWNVGAGGGGPSANSLSMMGIGV